MTSTISFQTGPDASSPPSLHDNDDDDDDDNDDNDDGDNDDDGYNDGVRQRWRRLPVPVPIDGML